MLNAVIYALHDPTGTSGRIYIGKTTDPRHRLNAHLSERRRALKNNWLRSLAARGVRPEMVILETVPAGGDWQEAERFWIESLRAMGLPLANGNGGGMGGHAPTPETRAKLSRAKLGRRSGPQSEEHRRKISLANKGRRPSAKSIERQRKAMTGRTLPPEQRDRLSDASRARRLMVTNKTGYKGVTLSPKGFFWAGIKVGGRRHVIGGYDTAIEAAVAYDAVARRLWGAKAALNFPRPGEQSARPGAPMPATLPSVSIRMPGDPKRTRRFFRRPGVAHAS